MSFPAATTTIVQRRLPHATFQADALQPQGFTTVEGGSDEQHRVQREREPGALIPLLTSGCFLLVHKSITIIDWPPIMGVGWGIRFSSHHASGFSVLAF